MNRVIRTMLCLAVAGLITLQADTASYTYDAAGRLTQVQYSNGQTIAYTYDAAGNLLTRTVTGASTPQAKPANRRK